MGERTRPGPSIESLADFVNLAERRLYVALVQEGERLLAKCERDDVIIRREVLMQSANLLLTAREVRARLTPKRAARPL